MSELLRDNMIGLEGLERLRGATAPAASDSWGHRFEVVAPVWMADEDEDLDDDDFFDDEDADEDEDFDDEEDEDFLDDEDEDFDDEEDEDLDEEDE